MGRPADGPGTPGAVRPRYGRMSAAAASIAVTVVAVLGAGGALPGVVSPVQPAQADAARGAMTFASFDRPDSRAPLTPEADRPADAPGQGYVDPGPVTPQERAAANDADTSAASGTSDTEALPANSGSGRRVVFSMSAQRVWLVGKADAVRRTYLVSGSLTDNLSPGTYEVYSTSRDAIGIDDSGTMKFMVRFAHGKRAAIGFHDIPVKDGEPLQTRAQLGTPQSHGCIRQWRPDAKALWDFAPVGTTVVVVA